MRTICFVVAFVLPFSVWQVGEGQGAEKSGPQPVVAVFSLDRPITEAPSGDDFPFSTIRSESLYELIARMKKVRDDEAVKGVVLLLGNSSLGLAQIEEIRQVIDQIKSAGKEVHVHADWLSMGRYVLLSGASKLTVVPTGHMLVTGMYGEGLYVRGLLDMIGVKPDFMTCGEYKSAAEMFMRTGPSEEAERMTNWLLDSLYDDCVRLIAQARGVPPERVRGWIDGGIYTAERAQELGMIDAVGYRQDFLAELKSQFGDDVELNKRYGKRKRDEIDLSSPFGVIKLWAELLQGARAAKKEKDAVAIVYVEGPILPGKPDPSPFTSGGIAYSTPIRRALDQAASDDSVKAVVLRVNSPGGSAVASEIILNATRRVAAKKPFVVSMGNVAGSGGYYVACGAETIFADPTTITASIGVVSGKFATTGMWNKIGIHWKSYHRGASAGLLSSEDVFTDEERQRIRTFMTDVYEVFKGHVVAARGDRLKKDIDQLAGGRVFTGRQAHELGLVDQLGALHDAIAYVAKQAELEDYEVRVLPKPKNFMEQLLSDLTGEENDEETISIWEGSPVLNRSASLFDLALPYLKGVEPRRLEAVKLALQQLSLLEKERAIFAMPVFCFGE